MKRQIVTLIIVTIMCISSMTVINNNKLVRADPSYEEDSTLDYDYIYSITENLSNVIYTAPLDHGIQKGREFGTTGELFAKDMIVDQMENVLELWNPNLDPPYLEQMEDIPTKTIVNITHKLDTLSQGLTINESGTPTPVIDYYISPRWNTTYLEHFPPWSDYDYDENLLTNNFSYKGLKVVRRPMLQLFPTFFNTITAGILENLLTDDDIAENLTLNDPVIFLNIIMQELENEYNFSYQNYDEIGPDNQSLPWYNETIANIGEDFVLIGENTFFNPNVSFPFYVQIIKDFNPMMMLPLYYYKLILHLQMLNFRALTHCKGLILYDHNEDTYDMNILTDMALPIIFVNKSVGEPIYDDTSIWNGFVSDTYTLDFHINQRYNTSVESYNIIGQINGTDSDKTVIISSYYDSWRAQGVVDGAIPMSTTLAIAKYMKKLETEYNIIPKYNIKFIAFCGEEYGIRGAYHYEATHPEEKIVTIIDLNQLGFIQTKPDLPLTLNIATNKLLLRPLLQKVLDVSRYEIQMAENDTDAKIRWMPLNGAPANDRPFAKNRSVAKWINGERRPLCKTINFLKDTNWTRHHRSGLNHTEGDSMEYYDSKDVALSADLIWNVTKLFTINPDSSFTEEPQHQTYDTEADENDLSDSINITFSLTTIMPQDRVTVKAVLYPKFTVIHPSYPFLYRYRDEKEYMVTPDGVNGYINISLPKDAPEGLYKIHLYVLNSSADYCIDALDSFGENFYNEFEELVMEIFGFNLTEILLELWDIFEEHFGGDIIDFIEFLQENMKPVFIDFIGAYIFADGLYNPITFLPMHPPNDAPARPERPTKVPEDGFDAGTEYEFTTSTTDINGDQVEYQWRWELLNYSSWSDPQDSGVDYTESHTWESTGIKVVTVRARDIWHSPNVFSSWSPPEVLSSAAGCCFSAPSATIIDRDTKFTAYTYGIEGDLEYYWEFEGRGYEEENSTPIHNFSVPTTYTVRLRVNTSDSSYYYNDSIDCKYIISDFTESTVAVQPNETIFFNETADVYDELGGYIEYYNWSFGDGNVTSDQNTNHSFNTTGVYNVTLTVEDNESHTDTYTVQVFVDTIAPKIFSADISPYEVGFGSNVTLYVNFFDNQSGVETAMINITDPNGVSENISMYPSYGSEYDYEGIFSNTLLKGRYNYYIWFKDRSGNSNMSLGHSFIVKNILGNFKQGNDNRTVVDVFAGSVFTAKECGVADNITAFLYTLDIDPAKKSICKIYQDDTLIGTTEELSFETVIDNEWVTFNFSDPKPVLEEDTDYYLMLHSNISYLHYDDVEDLRGRHYNISYNTTFWPSPVSWVNESRLYSIYCSYTPDTTTEINNVTDNPDPVGFGFNVTINADVTDDVGGVDEVKVSIGYPGPGSKKGNFTMSHIGGDTYEYVFDNTWLVGQYNYTIWAVGNYGSGNTSTNHSFNVSAQATINIATLQDTYGASEYINITDPPSSPEPQDWTIENNTVYLDTDDAYLSATPHTMKRSGWTTFELLSKQHSGSIDIGFGLDSDAMSFDTVQIWKNYVHDKYSYTFSEETRYVTFNDCTDFEPLDISLFDEDDFDVGNNNNDNLCRLSLIFEGETRELLIAYLDKTILDEENGVIEFCYNDEFWIETVTEEAYWDWKTIESDFDVVEYIFGDMNTWYFHKDIDIVEDHLYTFRIWVDVEEDSQGKYWWVMKPHNKNIQQAILDGQFYFLDPWWDVKHITTLLPDGDGDTTDWTSNPILYSNYECVDDDPDNPDDGGTYVYTKTGEDHDRYTMEDLMDGTNPPNNTSVEIQEVALFVYGRQGNVYIKPDWGIDYDSVQSLGNAWDWHSKNFSTVLNGSAITVSDIDDMIYDLKKHESQGYNCEVSAVYAEVAWNYIHPFEINYSDESPIDTSIGNTVDGDGITTSIDVSYWASSDVVLYESFTDAVSDEGSVYSSIVRGQTFTVDETFDVVNVSLKLKKIGSPSGSLRLDIYEVDVSEEPTGPSLSSAVINASELSTIFDWVDFYIDPYEFENGEMYAFVLNFSDGDSSNYINWSCDFDAGGYGDGEMLYSTDGGSSWSDPGEEADGLFKIYGITGEYYDLSFLSNSSGSWVEYGNVRVFCNGSYSVFNSNFSDVPSTYWWRLNASNSRGWDESSVFKFSTRNQSKIKNTGSTNISGYLLIQVQFWNETQGDWVVDNDTINETTPRTINIGEQLALDLIFNGEVSTDDLVNSDGTYRVYATFRDPDGDVLVCDDATKLEAWYEFEVDTS